MTSKKVSHFLFLALLSQYLGLEAMNKSRPEEGQVPSFYERASANVDMEDLMHEILRIKLTGKIRCDAILELFFKSEIIGEIPLKRGLSKILLVKDVFRPDDLGACFTNFMKHIVKESLCVKHLQEFFLNVINCLKKEDLEALLLPQDYDNVQKARFVAELVDDVGFKKVPQLMQVTLNVPVIKELLESFFELEQLRQLFIDLSAEKPVNRRTIIDCINFYPLLLNMECSQENLSTFNQGLRGLMSILIDGLQNSWRSAFESLLEYVGKGYCVHGIDQDESSVRELEHQESAFIIHRLTEEIESEKEVARIRIEELVAALEKERGARRRAEENAQSREHFE